jgi:hypothetical protein
MRVPFLSVQWLGVEMEWVVYVALVLEKVPPLI